MIRYRETVGMLSLSLLLVLGLACSDGGKGMLESTPLMAPFGVDGGIQLEEGLGIGASPSTIELDPCDMETPGQAMLAALVVDAELQPLAGVEVTFAASAGQLESTGLPLLTDENGMATDVLTVAESDAGTVLVTVTALEFEETLEIPVTLLEKPPVTLTMDPASLWPPNHKLREVHAVFEGLDCYPETTPSLASVTSDEPDNGAGDGDTAGDIQGADLGTDDRELLLRAERSGSGDGRVYTVAYELVLDEAEPVILTAEVTVPHDQGD